MAYHASSLPDLQDPDRLAIVCRRARQTLHAWQRRPEAREEAHEVNREDAEEADANDSADYIPTPDELWERREAVKASWSPLERSRRRVGPIFPAMMHELCVRYQRKGYPAVT